MVGLISQAGRQVKHLFPGDRCVADPTVAVGICDDIRSSERLDFSAVREVLLLPTGKV